MTEQTDNKKLIEEAKTGLAAFDEYWGNGGPVDAAYGLPWEMIRRLLAVFEKALTPTDDERETAVSRAYNAVTGQDDETWNPDKTLDALNELWDSAAGFRRSEVPEPSAEGYAEFENWEQEMFRHQPVLSMADGSIAGCQCLDRVFVKGREDWGTHLASIVTSRLSHEPQGEPSDAQVHVDHAFVQTGAVLAFECSCGIGRSEVVTVDLPQQVDAVAAAIAQAADADYWTDEIAAWEGAEAWEREAHPDNYPAMAYEDREAFRKQARAAVHAIAPQEGISA
ncbi:hypothetical protein F6W69_10560 [Microbacterium oxydans]|uniref:hypothetical protein n=1 Tax=Microbacterium oxydans TaxID=82380 RepID=UPI001143B85F|nr:hypothetical protein [Microbacterium oxydans]KAB1891032.1 hypothetical protein F6W69_10560 [Microbacterium oxydans]GED39108.1 hypothetical protein MOX01_22500 [Microbacterium oxydans]